MTHKASLSKFYPKETRFLRRDAVFVLSLEKAEDTMEIALRLRFEFGVSDWLEMLECSRYAMDIPLRDPSIGRGPN